MCAKARGNMPHYVSKVLRRKYTRIGKSPLRRKGDRQCASYMKIMQIPMLSEKGADTAISKAAELASVVRRPLDRNRYIYTAKKYALEPLSF